MSPYADTRFVDISLISTLRNTTASHTLHSERESNEHRTQRSIIEADKVVDVHAGDVMFIPSGWWYATVALSPSVAVESKFTCSKSNTASIISELKLRNQSNGAIKSCLNSLENYRSQRKRKPRKATKKPNKGMSNKHRTLHDGTVDATVVP